MGPLTTRKAVTALVAGVLAGFSLWSPAAHADPPPAVLKGSPPDSSAPPAEAPRGDTNPTAAPARPSPQEEAVANDVLRRLLRSGCRDGHREVRGLAGDPAAPWAETVTRLCGEILRDTAPDEIEVLRSGHKASRSPAPREGGVQEGRGRLVFWSSLYGIWAGIATDLLFDIDNDRSVILPPLIGMGVGMGLSLSLTAGKPITTGQAWTIITGLDYGTINGALWAGSFDFSTKGVVGTAVASSIAATTLGLAVADATSPSAGDVELVRSGLLWGGIGGSLALVAFSRNGDVSQNAALRSIAVCMDAGFLAGLALAKNFEVSRNRVLIIDAGALGGGMTGLGIAWMAVSPGSNDQALAGGALAGMLTGIVLATLATRDLDRHGDHTAMGDRSPVSALLARDADGHWRPGTPGPMPVFDGTGRRMIGATMNAIGGRF